MLVRLDDPQLARVRIIPGEIHLNVNGVIHGGAIASLIDVALFAGSTMILGYNQVHAVTVELNTHFLTPGDPKRPLDALVEVVRETGKMIFSRGKVVQDDNVVASYAGILRKFSPPSP